MILNPPSTGIQQTLGWVITILVPVALVLTAVRMLLTTTFVKIEYGTPNFPADPYGFSFADRIKWSLVALDYLLNDAGIEFLGDLTFENGTPLYNQRELGHMVDVKNVVQRVLRVWLISWMVVVGVGIWAWQAGWLNGYRIGLIRGGWVTIGFVGAVILFVMIAFGILFVFFHQVFFDPGTWTFFYSDTLIRLFPERFWRDTFISVGIISILEGLIVVFLFRRKF